MIKTYESISIVNNLSLNLSFGLTKVKIEFDHGNVSRGKRATYTTNDPFRQRVLDNAKEKGLLYRLARVVPEQGEEMPAAKPSANASGTGAAVETQEEIEAAAAEAAQAAYQEFLKKAQAAKAAKTAEETSANAEGTGADMSAAPEAQRTEPEAEVEGQEPEAEQTEQEPEAVPEEAENPAPSKKTLMKDMKFNEASEIIIYVMQNYGQEVDSVEAATKILRKHWINPVF